MVEHLGSTARLARSALALFVLIPLLGGCVRTSGSDSQTRGHAVDAWSQATGHLLGSALVRSDGDPIPSIALQTAGPRPLFDRVTAAIALAELDPHATVPHDVDTQLAKAIGDDGTVDDGISPIEVMTWYGQRLAAMPHVGSTAVAQRVRATRSALAHRLPDRSQAYADDPFTLIYWARTAEFVARALPVGAAADLRRAISVDASCRRVRTTRWDRIGEAFALAGAAQEAARAVRARCDRIVPDDRATRAAMPRLLGELAERPSLDDYDVQAISGMWLLGAAHQLDPAIASSAIGLLDRHLHDDQVDVTPTTVLLAVDTLVRAGKQPHAGSQTTAMLSANTTGERAVVAAPSSVAVLRWAELLRLVHGDGTDAIEANTQWTERSLHSLDRLTLAVAANDRTRVDLRSLDHADPGPITASIALLATRLGGHACAPPVHRYVQRAVAALHGRRAPAADNPFTASGFAALAVLARRCGQQDRGLTATTKTVAAHLIRLRHPDGLYGPTPQDPDVRLSATLALASCRLGHHAPPPRRSAVLAAVRPLRRTTGGAAPSDAAPISVDDTLAVAQLDALTTGGCAALER